MDGCQTAAPTLPPYEPQPLLKILALEAYELQLVHSLRTTHVSLIPIPEHLTSTLGHSRKDPIMPPPATSQPRLILTWILRILLGLLFLAIGIEKLTGTMGTIPFFAAIGWGQWFRYASGALDTAGALLILTPRFTSYGAIIITCTVGLGTILCFTMPLYNPIFPLAMTLLAALLIWLAWKPQPA